MPRKRGLVSKAWENSSEHFMTRSLKWVCSHQLEITHARIEQQTAHHLIPVTLTQEVTATRNKTLSFSLMLELITYPMVQDCSSKTPARANSRPWEEIQPWKWATHWEINIETLRSKRSWRTSCLFTLVLSFFKRIWWIGHLKLLMHGRLLIARDLRYWIYGTVVIQWDNIFSWTHSR